MASYSYVALDSAGKEKTGTISAGSHDDAVGKIREKGLFPTQVTEGAADAGGKKAGRKGGGGAGKGKKKGGGGGLNAEIRLPSFMARVKTKTLMVLTRQLATLVNAGLPLLRCLQVLQRQERNPNLKRVLGEVADSVQTGNTFAESLAQHPRIFNRLYVNMIKAGEVGGVMDVVLVRLAEFMEKAQRIRSKVISAMIYPIVVLFVAFAILTFLMIVVIPKFEEIFADLLEGQAMPALTQVVLNISRGFTGKLPFIIAAIVGVVLLLKLMRRFYRTRLILDHVKLRMPIFGVLVRKTAIARFTRTLGTLMSSGVPVLQALNIVRDTAGNEVIATAVGRIHDAVKEGENMAPPIENTGVFPPIVVSMVEVGEETGDLPDMLMKIADSYEDDVDNTVSGLTSIIEPILIVMLALIVGVIVIALFLPLISVIGKLS